MTTPLTEEIAEYFCLPPEFVIIESTHENIVWFRVTAGAQYTCKTVRNGQHLKKNSIRAE